MFKKLNYISISLMLLLTSCGETTGEENTEATTTKNNSLSSDSLKTGITGLDSIAPDNTEAISMIFGGYLANNLKKQGLDFMVPRDFIGAFNDCRVSRKTELPLDSMGAILSKIALATQNFASATDGQKDTIRNFFPQYFYADFSRMDLYSALKFDGFGNGFIKAWENNLNASEAEIKAFSSFSAKIQEATKSKQDALRAEMGKSSKKDGESFLTKNKNKPGVKTTASGLQYIAIKEGNGERPTAESTVIAHYEGTLINGKVFDSSYKKGQPLEFPLNGVIKGWTEGLQLMQVGAKYKFYIPYDLGYGERGAGRDIPPYSTLIFTVELKGIK
jgi:FKBP-type peptidyl-prolyl cis-trans isomerase FklB